MTEEKQDLTKKTDREIRLKHLQNMLADTADVLKEENRGLIVVFEGLDASGKSGCIRRLTEKLDQKQFDVHPIGKPTAVEYEYHYLHRFWTKLPPRGNIAFFDRSWYGRVLVERVEHLCSRQAWERAYEEINAFEKQLTDDGYLLLKLWMEVSEEEQLKRFQDRMNDPAKAHKITEEDWRNRSKRRDYLMSRDDMIEQTDSIHAPWIVIDGNRKPEARIRAAEEILRHCENCLGL